MSNTPRIDHCTIIGAMRSAVEQLGGSGIRVAYDSGITRGLDTVVRQSVLWGAKQASTEYMQMVGEELGCDGYEIDYHSSPRPSHEFMQGQQYAIGGARTVKGVRYEGFAESGAESALQDYGCLHFKMPIILGVSEPTYSKEQLRQLDEENHKIYEIDGIEGNRYDWSQKMRMLENEVRKEKREIEILNASGNVGAVKQHKDRIKAYQSKYKEISEVTGIAEDRKRMAYRGGGLTKAKNSDIIHTEINQKFDTKQTKQSFHVVQGKNLVGEVDYSKGEFDFDIEKAMHEQGFDGLPKVVSNDEFEKALEKSNFYAERTYSAPTQEILDEYRKQLYSGKWYVDCSEGGAQYGQGMYCAARFEKGKYIIPHDNKIGWEMSHYQEIGASKGNKFHYTEGITLQPDAKFFTLHSDTTDITNRYVKEYALKNTNNIEAKQMIEKTIKIQENIDMLSDRNFVDKIDLNKIDELYEQRDKIIQSELYKKEVVPLLDEGHKISRGKNEGTLAVEMGYDAINAVGHGEGGSYTVILNRTKVIFREGGSKYGN